MYNNDLCVLSDLLRMRIHGDTFEPLVRVCVCVCVCCLQAVYKRFVLQIEHISSAFCM